ncbi:hypothetical protein F5Y05DRAFT_138774 [Hypoxylon sp. FL0543]|nr:hypothetical protein F5Y05DRAFT_138774 [Hypoxylon sp. FL0543]
MLRSFVSGAAFGAALAAAAIHQPDAIIEQMQFRKWQMLTTFLTASGTSTLLVHVFQRLGYLHLKPRNYSTLNIFGPLDGNVIGGMFLGAGMTISGSCPGTVFAQIGSGIHSGLFTLGGAIIGGIIWSGLLRPVFRTRTKPASDVEDIPKRPLTVEEWTGTSQTSTFVIVESLFGGIIAGIVYLAAPESGGLVGPVAGGLLIASAQLLSIVTRRSLLGTSSSFEEVGDYFWWAVGRGVRPMSYTAIALTTGMIAGALSVSLASPSTRVAPEIVIGPNKAVLGGMLLSIGSRMAGGCTSGHGISGVSLLSVSSFVTVVAIFAGGMGTAMIMGQLNRR